MTVNIYQINLERDADHLVFHGWKEFEQHGYNQPSAKIYDLIYSYQTEAETPENVYQRFNLNLPTDFKGHSLSMSDIVEFILDTGERSCFFCDTFGFQPVSFESSLVGT